MSDRPTRFARRVSSMDARQSFYLNSNHDDRVQRTAKAIGPMRSLFHMSRPDHGCEASFCRASKLIRTFNAQSRRRHRLSRVDHASFTFFFIWRWLSGPRVYPSSRTIGSGPEVARWLRPYRELGCECFCLTSGVLGNEQPKQDHAVGLAVTHYSSFLSATLDSDLLGLLPSGGTPITCALYTFWRCVFPVHPVC